MTQTYPAHLHGPLYEALHKGAPFWDELARAWRPDVGLQEMPIAGCFLELVVQLPVRDQLWTYFRVQTPTGVAVIRRAPSGELLTGPFGQTSDPTYDAMEADFGRWASRNPNAGLPAKLAAIAQLYRERSPGSRLQRTEAPGRPCPACGHRPPSCLREGDLYTCPQCGLLHRESPSREATAALYTGSGGEYFNQLVDGSAVAGAHGYEFYEEWIQVILGPEYLRGRADRFEQMAGRTGGRLLEVGCATGEMLSEFRTRGWSVTGVELSAFCVERARQKHGLTLRPGDLESAGLPQAAFDLVLYMDVFEHLDDPARELAQIKRVLAPGGRLILELPNQAGLDAAVLGRDYLYDEHLFFYTPQAITHLLGANGLKVAQIVTLHDHYYRIHRFLTADEAARALSEQRGERLIVVAQRLSEP